ncbi:MAG: ATP-binding protein [Ilumatobacteraceae bacterium]
MGGDAEIPPLRTVMRESGVGWYPLVAIGALVLASEIFGFAVVVLGPEISRSLGISASALAGILSVKLLAVSLATLPLAAAVQSHPRRASLSVAAAFGWAALALVTVTVVGPWGLALVLVLDGAATGTVRALHQPLLLDTYPVSGRMRVLASYQAATTAGSVAAPLAVAALASWADLTWRGTMLGISGLVLAAALVASRLRDPGVGRWDTDRARDALADGTGIGTATDTRLGMSSPTAELRFGEVVRRLLMIPTIRRALAAQAVFGLMLVPYTTFLLFFLEERWRFGPTARAVFFALTSLGGVAALRWFAPIGERLFRRDPAQLIRVAAGVLAGSVLVVVPAALSPFVVPMVILFATSTALSTVMGPAVSLAVLSIVPARFRPHLAALAGIYLAGIGGVAGALLLGSLDRRFGVAGALVGVVVPGVIGALVLRSASRTIDDDLDRMIDELADEEAQAADRRAGRTSPLLEVHHVDHSYGQVQVLFGVDLRVEHGEIVALLGTNGAGKSTVLRVVSGLGLPSRGTVRFDGRDITWLDAERRVPLGILQVAGGRAAYGDMSVLDNLLVQAHSLGGDTRAVTAGVDRALAAFPRLDERRHQLASTLSGGERQMLALSKAFVLRPKLLLVDELSLGLAPKVVGELLEAVRRLHADGVSVVLVEQSVNVALSVAHRAYFLERGRVQFEGPASDLAGRTDLLRSVFLGGSAPVDRPSDASTEAPR